jgi:predicted N-acetyltransferase YhbS
VQNKDTNVTIRTERRADADAIGHVIEAAFQNAPHSSHTEQFMVDALRRCNQLTISLVAEEGDVVVGHVAISPVTISSGETGWYGLGPLAVLPPRQCQGIGSMLTDAALTELRRRGGAGCVVLGDPGYYGRFGFKADPGLELPGLPAEYFQALAFGKELPVGTVRYHPAFDVTAETSPSD